MGNLIPITLAFLPAGMELWVILLVIIILFGGRKIPELMRGVGKGVGELQKGLEEGRRNMEKTIDEEASKTQSESEKESPESSQNKTVAKD